MCVRALPPYFAHASGAIWMSRGSGLCPGSVGVAHSFPSILVCRGTGPGGGGGGGVIHAHRPQCSH